MLYKIKEALLPLGFASWLFAIWLFSTAEKTESALHEIEALLMVLVGAVLIVGASLVHSLGHIQAALEQRTRDEPADRGRDEEQ